MDSETQNTPVVELPNGLSKARIDDKGRIKLSAGFLHYFDSLAERKVYVTSLDGRIAEIYPISTYRETQKFFVAQRHIPAVRRAAFTAARLGSDCEVDSQGRVTINSELRAELGLDNQELHIQSYNLNRIRILSAAMFAEQMDDCKTADPKQDEEVLFNAGMP